MPIPYESEEEGIVHSGMNAYFNNLPNPYLTGSKEWNLFRSGWLLAQENTFRANMQKNAPRWQPKRPDGRGA